MRGVTLAAVLGVGLVLWPAALRGEDRGADTAQGSPAGPGAYGRDIPPSQALPLPRFDSSVDVTAVAPRDYDASMAVFWRQWNLSTGSIYGKGLSPEPGLPDLREYPAPDREARRRDQEEVASRLARSRPGVRSRE